MNWCAYEMDHRIEKRHAREEGIAEGQRIGLEKGRKKEREIILLMNQRLLKEKRYEDLERASKDNVFRERLMAELFPEKMLSGDSSEPYPEEKPSS